MRAIQTKNECSKVRRDKNLKIYKYSVLKIDYQNWQLNNRYKYCIFSFVCFINLVLAYIHI